MRHPISLFTACAPWLPLDELAPLAAAAGIGGIDLACKPHRYDPSRAPGFWDNNAAVLDLDRADVLAPAAARVLSDWRLKCPVLAGYASAGNTEVVRRLAAVARTIGSGMVRLWVDRPERGRIPAQFIAQRAAWREVARIAAGEGVRFVLETHDGTLATGASGALRLLDGIDSLHVGVIYDIANTVREGSEPLETALGLLGPYLAHVQVKDVWHRSGGTSWDGTATGFAPLGQGTLRWPTIIGTLDAAGYHGWLSIENFTGLDLGPSRIAQDASWLRDMMEAAGGTDHT
jgi:sugar phosphate isomerase/epimerase